MVSVDGRVGSVAFGLGGECVDQESGSEPSDGHDNDNHPGDELQVMMLEQAMLADRFARSVAGKLNQCGMDNQVAEKLEDDGPDARDDPDKGRQHDPLAGRLPVQSLEDGVQRDHGCPTVEGGRKV